MTAETTRPARGTARGAILKATLRVVADAGIDAVTHRRVAELAGVSPGSTTHHFASREDLIRAAFRAYLEFADRLLAGIDEELRATVSDDAVRVREYLCEIVRREFTDERMVRAEYEMILFASADDELGSYLRAWEARWIAYIAEGLEAAGHTRAVETARILINLVRGYELERLLNPRLGIDELRRRIDVVVATRAVPQA
jgi:TetR/AcrR family transcriptional regulator, regulator of biofilm formation and stress response